MEIWWGTNVMSDPVSNYNAPATQQVEQSDGTFKSATLIQDLHEVFHPLEGDSKASPTGYMINGKDLCEIFHPVAVSGKEIPSDTGYTVSVTDSAGVTSVVDLRKIFARKNSLAVQLVLNQLPAGAFDCDTYFRAWLDRSGSMDTALSYIEPAVTLLSTFISKVYNNRGKVFSVTGSPFEKCATWIGSSLDGNNPPKEVQIAFINESDSGGIGDRSAYYTRWKAVKDLGGIKYGAIGGVEIPGHHFAGEIKTWLENQIAAGQAEGHNDIGLSGFFNINDSTSKATYLQMLVTWLNIPTEPGQLDTTLQADNSGHSTTSCNWIVDDYICGLTHMPDASSAGYSKTQKHWLVEISTDINGTNIIHTEEHLTRPIKINHVAQNGTGNQFFCRITAVANGNRPSNATAWVECLKANRPPTIRLNDVLRENNQVVPNKLNIGETYVDPGAVVYEKDDFTAGKKDDYIYSSDSVDNTVADVYNLKYEYTDNDGVSATETRQVEVVNTKPTLTLIGQSTINIQ